MNSHGCTPACGGICHLSDVAQTVYLELIYVERFEDADALRTRGAIPA